MHDDRSSLEVPWRQARRVRAAFTLVELLVVIAVIAIVVSLVSYAATSVRGSGKSARELALARQLMLGYTAYAADHKGALMPGYYNVQPALPIPTDEQGKAVSGPAAHRYAWRLAPYLDLQLKGLIDDPWLLEDLRYTTQFDYFVSLYPAMGLNTTFVGGDSSAEGLGFNPAYKQLYGNFYLTRLSQARRPADLIVFGSARTNATYEAGAPPIIEGYFKIESPNLLSRRWDADWNVEAPPKQWGFLSLRLKGERAAFGFLDGHTGLLDNGEMQDMRKWCDLADAPNWKLGD
jgi:prepilin-type N-terminal cleavage/methylation domain-containing protein